MARRPRTLADKLLAFADRDNDISRELQQWRKVSEVSGENQEPADLKPLITEMLSPGRGFIAWNESYSYVRRAEAVLPLLQQARDRDAAAAATLCLHALRRTWGVLEQADDSDGEIGGLCQAIGAEWVLSLQAAGPQPASFGDTYLQLQLDDPFGCFDSAAAEAAIGDAAMARYQRAVAERWRQAKDAVLALKAEHAAKVASRKGRAPVYEQTTEQEMRLWTLERLHLAQLERSGQVDEALSVLREDLSDAHAHHRIVDFLEQYRRYREAFTQAEQGNKAFPDDQRLQNALLRCYERDGWTAEALALRRKQLESSPSVERYHQVLKAGQADSQGVAALRQALLDFLAAQELQAMSARSPTARWAAPGRRGHAERARRHIAGTKSCAPKGCGRRPAPSCSRRWQCSGNVLHEIAMHLSADQNEQALELLMRFFNSEMQRASSPYEEEIALVKEIGQRMDAARRVAWLAQLRTSSRPSATLFGTCRIGEGRSSCRNRHFGVRAESQGGVDNYCHTLQDTRHESSNHELRPAGIDA